MNKTKPTHHPEPGPDAWAHVTDAVWVLGEATSAQVAAFRPETRPAEITLGDPTLLTSDPGERPSCIWIDS